MVIRCEAFAEFGVFGTGSRTREDLHLRFQICLRQPWLDYAPKPSTVCWCVHDSLTRDGSHLTEPTLELVRSNRGCAAGQGAEALLRVHPILDLWLVEIIQHSALASERKPLRCPPRLGYGPASSLCQVVSLLVRVLREPVWRMRIWRRPGAHGAEHRA